MHARHYSPALGRFLQPDPDGSEANLYAYTANNPVTELDPSGTCFILCVVLVGAILFGSLGAATEVATYAATTPQDQWSAEAAGDAALWGGASGAFLAVPAPGGRIVGSALARALAKVPKAGNAAREVARASTERASDLRSTLSAWDKGTFNSRAQSLRYHYEIHGTGQGVRAYTREAQELYRTSRSIGTRHPLGAGGTGVKIRTNTRFGIYTPSGRVVSFGPR